jgi:predicted PurR-regulated permease PerM
MQISFSDRQQQVIARALTGLAVLVLVSLSFLVFWGVLRFLSVFSNVLMPLATAGILSLLLRPLEQGLHKKTGLPRKLTAGLTLLAFFVPLLAFLFSFSGIIAAQLIQMLESVPDLWDRILNWISEKFPALGEMLEDSFSQEEIDEWVASGSEPLMRVAQGGMQGLQYLVGAVSRFLSWVVLPVYMFFFLYAPPFCLKQFEQFLPFLRPEVRKDVLFLIDQFVQTVVEYFRGQLTIAILQAMILATGYTLSGLRYGFILGVILGLLNFIPYVGNILSIAITFPLAWFQPDGGLWVLMGVILTLLVEQTVESYYLTPKIMNKKTGLHPMAVIFAMFFWGQVFQGIFGLILAVPLTAFLVVFWRLAKDKYLHPAEE